jgi:hypothetical protein
MLCVSIKYLGFDKVQCLAMQNVKGTVKPSCRFEPVLKQHSLWMNASPQTLNSANRRGQNNPQTRAFIFILEVKLSQVLIITEIKSRYTQKISERFLALFFLQRKSMNVPKLRKYTTGICHRNTDVCI